MRRGRQIRELVKARTNAAEFEQVVRQSADQNIDILRLAVTGRIAPHEQRSYFDSESVQEVFGGSGLDAQQVYMAIHLGWALAAIGFFPRSEAANLLTLLMVDLAEDFGVTPDLEGVDVLLKARTRSFAAEGKKRLGAVWWRKYSLELAGLGGHDLSLLD